MTARGVPAFAIPEAPTDAESLVGEESAMARYEDISQDGRLRVEGIWHPTGRLLWSGHSLGGELMRWGREHGLRTVLTRVVLDVENVAVGPRVPARTELRYRFEHARDAGGAVRRLFFSTWLRTDAPPVEGGGPVDRPSGAPRVVARAYGQRTFARLDAPPGQRSVTELPHRGVPPHVGQSVDARSLLELPPGAVPLDDAPRPSPLRVVFGLSHTDANQHVNFMAYPRYLEQAALGRSVELGRGAEIMARRVELGYRRPSFAGEIIRLVLRAFALGDDLGVCAAFVDDADDAELARTFEAPDRVRCAARMLLTR